MKKLKVIVANLCVVVALALAVPTVALAEETGPQGGVKSTTTAPQPPPPPPDVLFWIIIRGLL